MIARKLSPEQNITAEVSGKSALILVQDSIQAVSLRMRKILEGVSTVWLDNAMMWPLDMRKSNGVDSVTYKHLRASLRIVLQGVTKSWAFGVKVVDSKRT